MISARLHPCSQKASSACLIARWQALSCRLRLQAHPTAYFCASRYYAAKAFPTHEVIAMPALSPTMTSGNIGTWQKRIGDAIVPGDVLVEIETDKAQMDFEFQDEGIIAQILKPSGEKDVPVGTPIAVMVEDTESVPEFSQFTFEDALASSSSSTDASTSPPSTDTAPPSLSLQQAPEQDHPRPTPVSEPVPTQPQSTGKRLQPSLDRYPLISPTIRKLAEQKNFLVTDIVGSGPDGRITEQDVLNHVPTRGSATSTSSTTPASVHPTSAAFEDTPASAMRKAIATRLTDSFQSNPHYYISSSISVTKISKVRQAINVCADGKFKLSLNDCLIKAIAIAANRVPAVNSSWVEPSRGVPIIRQFNTVDVSVAVATPTGLITPIVRNVAALGLRDISATVHDLANRAKKNKLKPEEYQGGTITISNMGMNDAVERFTAIINSPQSTIVAVGTVKQVPVPVRDTLIGSRQSSSSSSSLAAAAATSDDPASRLTSHTQRTQQPLFPDHSPTPFKWDDQIVITASFDHKVVDGAVGAQFMAELKKVIENPLEMLL